jgi:hypothetical protein
MVLTPTIVIGVEQRSAERIARRGGDLAAGLGARVVLTHLREDVQPSNLKSQRERARHRSTRRVHEILRRATDACRRRWTPTSASRSVASRTS